MQRLLCACHKGPWLLLAGPPLLSSQLPQHSHGPHGPAHGPEQVCTRCFTLCSMLDSAGDIVGTPGGRTWGLGGNHPGRALGGSGQCLGWPRPTVPSRHQQLMKKAAGGTQQTYPGLITLRPLLAFVQIHLFRPAWPRCGLCKCHLGLVFPEQPVCPVLVFY